MSAADGSLTQTLRRTYRHGLGFMLAKGSVLLAPLLAARFWSASDYGRLEWWIAVATVAGSGLAMGAPALIAFEAVKNESHLTRIAVMHVVIVAALATMMAVLWWFWAPASTVGNALPALLAAQVTLQMTLSGHLKGSGLGAIASFSESGIYLITLLVIVMHTVGWPIVPSMFAISVVVQILLALLLLQQFRPAFPAFRDWGRFLVYGPKIMAASFALLLLSTAPRLLLGHLANDAALAEFALSYRWLAIAIIAHQFIGTVFFRNIYAASPGKQDKKLLIPLFGVTGLSAMIAFTIWMLPHAIAVRLPLAIPDARAHSFILLIAAAMPLWSGVALMEGIFYREHKAARPVGAFLTGFLTTAVVYVLLTRSGTDNVLVAASAAWFSGLATAAAVQWTMLRLIDIHLPRLGGLLLAIVLIAIGAQAAFGGS